MEFDSITPLIFNLSSIEDGWSVSGLASFFLRNNDCGAKLNVAERTPDSLRAYRAREYFLPFQGVEPRFVGSPAHIPVFILSILFKEPSVVMSYNESNSCTDEKINNITAN